MSICCTFKCSLVLVAGIFFAGPSAAAQEKTAAQDGDSLPVLIEKCFTAAGGREQRLSTFRMIERYNAGVEKAAPEKSQPRSSVLQPPNVWIVGEKERGSEPAKFVVWAWTLGILDAPQTKLETIPGTTENGHTTRALRASGSVTPAMDLHFDPQSLRLVRVDWRDDIYRFSDWREHDGAGFHAQTTIWKKNAVKPWFFHEVVSVERLEKLP